MRDYGKVAPTFWTGETGRALRKAGPEAQLVALYLVTCQSAHMSGIFYLAVPTLCHETGLSLKGASKALARVSEGGFAYFDEASEVVWVPEMAHYQVGETLTPRDNRHKALVKYLENFRKSRFYKDFYARYGDCFHLERKPLGSPLEAPTKGRARVRAEQEQEQEQEQEKEQEKEDCSEPLRAASEPAVLVFPTVGKIKTWPLTGVKLDEYRESYPGVDVLAECRKARQWCLDNGPKRKTAQGMPAFLGRWLAKEQDRGGRSSTGGSNGDPRGNIATVNRYLEAINDGTA